MVTAPSNHIPRIPRREVDSFLEGRSTRKQIGYRCEPFVPFTFKIKQHQCLMHASIKSPRALLNVPFIPGNEVRGAPSIAPSAPPSLLELLILKMKYDSFCNQTRMRQFGLSPSAHGSTQIDAHQTRGRE